MQLFPTSALTAMKGPEIKRRIDAHREWKASEGEEGERADFSGADLDGKSLCYHDLSGAVFEEASLEEVRFRFADLSGANFDGANLTGANFWGADFESADLGGASFEDAELREAKARAEDFLDLNDESIARAFEDAEDTEIQRTTIETI